MKESTLWWRRLNPYCTIFVAILSGTSWRNADALHPVAQTVEEHHIGPLNHELTDQICRVVTADLKGYSIAGMEPFSNCRIQHVTSATGDDARTILADIGSMGASTDAIVVYRLDHGITTAVKFKDRKGKIWTGGVFENGSSATHSDNVTLSPHQHALYTTSVTGIREDGSAETCEVHAYQWAPKVRMYVERATSETDRIRCHH